MTERSARVATRHRAPRLDRVRPLVPRWTSLREPVRQGGPGVALVLLWIAVMTVAQAVRQPGVPSWDSVWQEDGGIFLTDALFESFPEALVHSYNAYLHVVPRLVAEVAAALPLERAAFVLSVGSALVVALLSVYVYFASASLLRSEWARVLLAAVFVLLPATAYETNANVANLHWYLLFACFWVFLDQPESWSRVGVGAAITIAAVLSDPMAGLFLPLAMLMVYKRRARRDLVVPVVFFLALAFQLVLGAFATSPAPYAASHVADLPGIFALRVVGSFLVGDRFLDELWGHLRWWFAYTGLAVVSLALGYGLWRARVSTRFYVMTSLAYSVLFLAVPLMLRGTERFLDGPGFNLNGSRYMVVPLWFLVLAALLLLDGPELVGRETGWRKLQQGFVLYTLALVLVNFSGFSVRTAGPSWREQLAVARAQCEQGQRPDVNPPGLGPEMASRARDYGADVLILIAPNIEPHPFAVPVTCEHLR